MGLSSCTRFERKINIKATKKSRPHEKWVEFFYSRVSAGVYRLLLDRDADF